MESSKSASDEGTETASKVEVKQDEFSYLEREFTSELFKLEINNLGIFGIGDFKKMLKSLEIDAAKVKTPHKRDCAFICLKSKEALDEAIKKLTGYVWKGKTLSVKIARPNADPYIKRKNEEQQEDSNKKVKRTVESQTVPLAHLTYDQQLEEKDKEMRKVLTAFGNNLRKLNPSFKLRKDEIPCEFEKIKPSPKIDDYRNKSEFAIGRNSNNEIVVGFRVGSYSDGSVEVGEIAKLPHIPSKVKEAVLKFQDFVRQSKFLPFNPEFNSGHFRQLMVRYSEFSKEIMLVPGMYSNNLTEDDVTELKQSLKDFYSDGEGNLVDVDSLYYQHLGKRETGEMFNPVDHLCGKTHITDVIHGLSFRVSPLAFFQVNTAGAEVLYQSIIDLSEPKENTTVLDICCGTGTIGLCFAKYCKNVVGVEIIPDAIEDAKFNAEQNKINNCKFHVGNSDDYIQSMVKEVVYGTLKKEDLDLVAILDPPRSGLHKKSISAVRSALDLKKIIYVACNPKAAERNWLDLCKPESKTYKGDPFRPKKAIAVDMFPHTSHTELVMLLER
ncbi:TRMT2A family protein [Megaselia abdita]